MNYLKLNFILWLGIVCFSNPDPGYIFLILTILYTCFYIKILNRKKIYDYQDLINHRVNASRQVTPESTSDLLRSESN